MKNIGYRLIIWPLNEKNMPNFMRFGVFFFSPQIESDQSKSEKNRI